MARFDGKVILISGGARGMGATEARLLAAEGARIVIGDVLVEQGEKLAAELGTSCVFVKLDVADPADWDRAIAAATALGGLHGLVNNAGVYIPKSLPDTDLGNWERHLRINQTGVYLGMKAGAAAMTTGAAIVNLSSTAGLRGTPHAFAYGATKWAVRGMTTHTGTPISCPAVARAWPWLPELCVITPRRFCSSVNISTAFMAPRNLNAPIF